VFLQYASDPIVFFDPGAIWRRPVWMREPPAPDVSPDLSFMPVVTQFQLALDMEAAGEATIIFPTKMNLGKLAEAESVPTAISRFREGKVVTVLPVVGKDENGNPCLHIPAEAGYVQTIEPLEKIENVAKR
ncbi:alpha/beta-hydrolase family protein, partial [Henriciella sp.]|uniref:alpha/beta-hydrolase family protein n=1 Tax=Henriciella sp. TaxID=1968823 RepID=UPI0025BA8124